MADNKRNNKNTKKNSTSRRKKRKVNQRLKSVMDMGLFFLIVLVITYILINFVGQKTVVHNVSMNDTLFEGDNVIMDKFSYIVGEPERFDIICFKSYKEKDLLIKRIIGLPGESVRILAGRVYINGEEIKDVNGLDEPSNPGRAAETITLDDDEYFVLGDNRAESIDSRSENVGNIRKKDILGKAAYIIYPFNRIRKIK